MIEPTPEMKAAVNRRLGRPEDTELDPAIHAAIGDVLAILRRDYRLALRAGAVKPRRVAALDHDPAALKQARMQAGWRQRHLAEAVGISVSLLSEAEKGTRGLAPAVLERIAAILGCPAATFDRKAAS